MNSTQIQENFPVFRHSLKKDYFPKWKNAFIWFSIFYFSGLTLLIPSFDFAQILHFLFFGISIIAFLIYSLKQGISKTGGWLLAYCILFPIYASFNSEIIFGQPLYLGLLSLRYLALVLFAYCLLLLKCPYVKLINHINIFNIWVAGMSVFLIVILDISPARLNELFLNTNFIEVEQHENSATLALRGYRFSQCSEFMIISYVYYLLQVMRNGSNKKYLLPFLLLMFYLLFVHKGRQPVGVLGCVFICNYLKMKGLTPKRFLFAVVPFIAIISLDIAYPEFFDKFTMMFSKENNKDFSALARFNSISSVWPYIQEHLFFGIGNLSSRFREQGFQTFFGSQFYIADIGIVGALARGGISLLIIYCGLYYSLLRKSGFIKFSFTRSFIRYMLLSIVLLLFLFNDVLFGGGCVILAFLFYPLFGALKRTEQVGVLNGTL